MSRARIFPLLAMLLALGAAGSAQKSAPASAPQAPYAPPAADAPEVRSVRRVLDPRRRGDRPAEELVRDLVALGPRSAPVYVALLTGALPGTDWEDSGLTLEESRGDHAGDELLLLEALRGLPPGPVAHALGDACAAEPSLDKRLVGLHLLGEVGQGPEAVLCWQQICKGVEEVHLRRAYVRAQLENALGLCLSRSARGFEPIVRGVRQWDRKLLPAVVHACLQANRRQGVDVLFELRATDRELDLELLVALPKLAAATRGGVDERHSGWMRGFLSDEDPNVRATALLGLGQVCDADSVQSVIEALGDSDERVPQAALWSLQHMSGQPLARLRPEWEAWFSGEQGWWKSERPDAIRLLESQDSGQVVEGLRQLAAHPLYRHEDAAAIASLREHEDPAVLRAACAALQQLCSMAGADALAAMLTRPEEDVRAAALEALVTLTGQTLPAQPEAWQQLLGN